MRAALSRFKNTGFAIALLGTCQQSLAGHSIGNGGTAIACTNGQTEIFQALDYYDAIKLGSIQLGGDDLQLMIKVRRKLHEIAKFDKILARQFLGIAERFFREAVFLDDEQVAYLGDIGKKLYPEECHFEQVIVHYPPANGRRTHYAIAKQRWARLDADNQAVLIIHEVLYREAFKRGQIDSQSTRDFMLVLLRDGFLWLSNREFEELLLHAHLTEYYLMIHDTMHAQNPIALRLFDSRHFTYKQAKDFCEVLSPSGKILSMHDAFKWLTVDPEAPLLRRIEKLGANFHLWDDSEDTLIYNFKEQKLLRENPEAKHAFICFQQRSVITM
ncbi:MAG: hypothetical protein NTV34_18800 [Proteobacteria bacterium]|nr:hypothetical protein [Pseudomonadota bacterium]